MINKEIHLLTLIYTVKGHIPTLNHIFFWKFSQIIPLQHPTTHTDPTPNPNLANYIASFSILL